jgi:hypothetical protein
MTVAISGGIVLAILIAGYFIIRSIIKNIRSSEREKVKNELLKSGLETIQKVHGRHDEIEKHHEGLDIPATWDDVRLRRAKGKISVRTPKSPKV